MKTLRSILTMCLLLALLTAWGQGAQITVRGVVTDASTGDPIAGVTVIVERTKVSDAVVGTTTGIDGAYSLKASVGDELRFTYLGYEDQTLRVKGSTLNVKLIPNALDSQEQEIVVLKEASSSAIYGARASSGTMVVGGYAMLSSSPSYTGYYPGSEDYARIKENRFVNVVREPLSTFALEVDAASYSNVRRMLNEGTFPPKDAVRAEEFVNYFNYDYAQPVDADPLKVNYEVGTCPWNTDHLLVQIGLKAREIEPENLPAANFVFLVDVSGSMEGPNRLPLVVSSLKLLLKSLRAEDRVAIVTYADTIEVPLGSTPGNEKQKIRNVLESLTAHGGTAGGKGIQKAYKIAHENFIEGGNNRIILATDGDFNIGVANTDDLGDLVEKERKSGVFLTMLGYGMGNYKDEKLQTLAEKGNGNFYYIDNMQEANRVLVKEFAGTTFTLAKDVKLQVEFNPSRVKAYRLVGYESRLLEAEDFNDDKKDAGEIGVGHTVTALYEIVPAGSKSKAGSVDSLKYQQPVRSASPSAFDGELMTVKIRYKQPDGDQSRKIEVAVPVTMPKEPSVDFHFASAAAMFAQLLRDSDFKGDATYKMVVDEAKKGLGKDTDGYRSEFIRLVKVASELED